jgi:hypothetical protein
MVKVIQLPLTLEGLKVYKEKSPSKYKDKFGDLDLDNIPQEWMKKGMFPNFRQDGTPETDKKGNVIMHEEEYFDAIGYRKHLIDTVRPKTPLIDGLKVQPAVDVSKIPASPDMTPSHIGDELH